MDTSIKSICGSKEKVNLLSAEHGPLFDQWQESWVGALGPYQPMKKQLECPIARLAERRPWTGVVDFSVFKTFSFFFSAQSPDGKGNLRFFYGFDVNVCPHYEVTLIFYNRFNSPMIGKLPRV